MPTLEHKLAIKLNISLIKDHKNYRFSPKSCFKCDVATEMSQIFPKICIRSPKLQLRKREAAYMAVFTTVSPQLTCRRLV